MSAGIIAGVGGERTGRSTPVGPPWMTQSRGYFFAGSKSAGLMRTPSIGRPVLALPGDDLARPQDESADLFGHPGQGAGGEGQVRDADLVSPSGMSHEGHALRHPRSGSRRRGHEASGPLRRAMLERRRVEPEKVGGGSLACPRNKCRPRSRRRRRDSRRRRPSASERDPPSARDKGQPGISGVIVDPPHGARRRGSTGRRETRAAPNRRRADRRSF